MIGLNPPLSPRRVNAGSALAPLASPPRTPELEEATEPVPWAALLETVLLAGLVALAFL